MALPHGKGIWMSLVLRPNLPLALTPQLTLLAGVAVCTAIREVTGVPAGIKWPNDLLAGGRKICGIPAGILASGRRAALLYRRYRHCCQSDRRGLPGGATRDWYIAAD
ncbi:biotin--[acetyl-CoA-carboxylase] ligase [Paenibacillus rhizoplanae]